MKVVYHEKFTTVYTSDPAAAPGRIEAIYNELCSSFEFVEPEPASEKDLALVHGTGHIASMKARETIYELAALAAGAAIKASEIAMEGEGAFALIRPPGHHASPNSCWGFCFFNNIAISIEKLRRTGKIKHALIIDIDLHYGDGTAKIFENCPEVDYFHPEAANRESYLVSISNYFAKKKNYDIIAVSAGFDRHEDDWGGMLVTGDYRTIGKMVKELAEKVCAGKRYGVLEGGYNHAVLGRNVRALLEGMK